MSRLSSILIALCLSFSVNFAQAEVAARGDVEVLLQQYKVEKPGKTEVLVNADRIKPGETIEYQAVYRNVSRQTVRQLQATLPIPHDTEYLPGSAKPAGVQATADGVNYAPIPLRRKVKLTSGQIEEQDIPLSEYRSLRWNIGDLAAGQKTTVSARVRLAQTGQAEGEKK